MLYLQQSAHWRMRDCCIVSQPKASHASHCQGMMSRHGWMNILPAAGGRNPEASQKRAQVVYDRGSCSRACGVVRGSVAIHRRVRRFTDSSRSRKQSGSRSSTMRSYIVFNPIQAEVERGLGSQPSSAPDRAAAYSCPTLPTHLPLQPDVLSARVMHQLLVQQQQGRMILGQARLPCCRRWD